MQQRETGDPGGVDVLGIEVPGVGLLRDAFAQLRPALREVLIQTALQRWPIAELADVSGVTATEVSRSIFFALKELRLLLDEMEPDATVAPR